MTRRELLLVALAGVVLTSAFPPLSLPFSAPLALGTLAVVVRQSDARAGAHGLDARPHRRRFLLGFVFGVACWLFQIGWLFLVVQYNGWVVGLGVMVLVVWLSAWTGAAMMLYGLVRGPLVSAVWFAASWTALEFLRSLGELSFTWGYLGHVAWQMPFLLRLAGIGGVPLLSFLFALTGGLLASIYLSRALRREVFGLTSMMAAVWALALFLCWFAPPQLERAAPLHIALIQGNHPQSIKWDVDWEELFTDYAALTRRAQQASPAPALIVWPEVALARFFEPPSECSERVLSLVREASPALIAGFINLDVNAAGRVRRIFNSAVLLRPQTDRVRIERYDKQQLLPFAEYVPFRRFLPFVQAIVESASGGAFEPGHTRVLWTFGEIVLAPLICFESTVPQLARRALGPYGNALLVITNDAWFEPSAGPVQHLLQSVFRAIENGVPVLHCGNTGETCLIGADGRIAQRLPRRVQDILFLSVTPGSTRGPVYRRWGDWFGWFVLTVTAAGTGALLLRRSGTPLTPGEKTP